jgi:hypothetical protein
LGARPGVKWQKCEVDHTHLYIAEVKNRWSRTSNVSIRLRDVDTENFTCTRKTVAILNYLSGETEIYTSLMPGGETKKRKVELNKQLTH